MREIPDSADTSRELSRWRTIFGYIRGMFVEISAVAAISSAALLVMFLVRIVVR
jgi:hypothetical protein